MKRITLTEWAEAMFSRQPHINTLRSWARSGHIPGAVKVGRDWFVRTAVTQHPALQRAGDRPAGFGWAQGCGDYGYLPGCAQLGMGDCEGWLK